MVKTELVKIALCFFVLTSTGSGQDKAVAPTQAEVTFYSTGSFWKSAIPGYKHGDFIGLIFDDEHILALMKQGRFVTFNLAPGKHIFSTNYWLNRSPEGGAHLQVDLVAGQHYFVGTYFTTSPALVVSTPRIEQATCQQAEENAKSAKPLARHNIQKDALPLALSESSFPTCP
jgi:hypothetical protein